MADVQTPGTSEAEGSRGQSGARRSLFRRLKRRTMLIVAAVAVVLLGGALAATLLTSGGSSGSSRLVNGNSIVYAVADQPLAPDFSATSLTGATIKMSSYRGKVVVLNFWGSWCAPCRGEAETLEVASQHYRAQGVDFLGDDVADTPANALSFIHSEGISYPSINDPGYAVVAQFSSAAPVSDTPTTVVIGKTGHVVGMVLGAVSTSELTTLLHQAGVSS